MGGKKASLFIGTERSPCYARPSTAPRALPTPCFSEVTQRKERQGSAVLCILEILVDVLVSASIQMKESDENLIKYNRGIGQRIRALVWSLSTAGGYRQSNWSDRHGQLDAQLIFHIHYLIYIPS